MVVLQTATFFALMSAFVFRIPRAVRHREARLTCIGTGVGALAMLTLGIIVPQSVLDAPLGGHNMLKLVQTSLALVAIWLGAQAAIALAPQARRMSPVSVLVIVALPAIPFLFMRRTDPTNTHFLDHNITQLPAWLYASLYLAALVYVALRLVIAFGSRGEIGAWLIKLGAGAIVIASLTEEINFTIQFCGCGSQMLASNLSSVFNIVFYLGVCTMTLGIVAYASARTIRQWQVPRILSRIQEEPLTQERLTPSRAADSELGELYLATVAMRDLVVAGRLRPNRSQARTLRRAERIIAHSLSEPLGGGAAAVTTYTGKAA